MEITQNITVTAGAAEKVNGLLIADMYKDKNIAGLRVYVQGGGCSGFSYGFAFETDINTDDMVFEMNDAKFIVDPMSMMYLNGSTLDYIKEVMGEQFTIINPNSKSTCGCGSSFSV